MLTPLATPLATPRATPLATPLQTAAERASGNTYRRQCRDISGRLRQRQRRRLSGPAPRPDTRRRHVQQIPSLTNAPTTATTSRRTSRRGPRKPRRRSIPTPIPTEAHTQADGDGSARTCPDARADINVADRADAPPDSRADDRDDDPPDARPDAREISARRGRTYSCRTESRSEAGSCTTEALASSCTTEASAGTIAWAGGTVAANIRDQRRRPLAFRGSAANFTQVKHTRWFHREIFTPGGVLGQNTLCGILMDLLFL